MQRNALYSGLLLAALACSKPTGEAEATPAKTDPLAGRTRYTIVYGGNMWGDLLECG